MKDKIFKGVFAKYLGKPVACSYVGNKWGYKWRKVDDDFFFPIQVVNPHNGKIIGYTAEATDEQMKTTGESAKQAQEYWYLKVGQQEKEAIFMAFRNYVQKYRGELAQTMTLEMGKPTMTADGEVQELLDTIDHYFGELSRMEGEFSECQAANKMGAVLKSPYGVVYAIAPWNFPLAISIGWKMLAAVTAGNSVVLKACSQSPFTAAIGVALFQQAVKDVVGEKIFSERLYGLVQLIQGSGSETGAEYLENGKYDLVAFTGGKNAGAKIGKAAAAKIKPFHLELGGHGAIVVFEDFDIDRAVSEAIIAGSGDAGQRCVSARVVFVEESIYGKFIEKYLFALKSRRIGNPLDVETQIGPLVNKSQLERVAEAVETAKKSCDEYYGGVVLNGKELVEEVKLNHWNIGDIDIKGCYYLPAVLINPPMESIAMEEEIFGPVLCVKPFGGKTREEKIQNAVDLVNASKYGLSNAVLTHHLPTAFKIMKLIKTGILYIGRGTSGAELNRYFGGVKDSGHGREGKGVDAYVYKKQIYFDYHPEARLAQIGATEEVAKKMKGKKTIFG